MAQIQINDDNYVTGYCTLGSIDGGIEIDDGIIDSIEFDKLKFYKYSEETKDIVLDENKYNEYKLAISNQIFQDMYIPSEMESMVSYVRNIIRADSSSYTIDQKLQYSGMYDTWTPGKYDIGDIRNYAGQTWECYQAHDNNIYPDINPNNSAWYTFWRPLHGTSPETARPFTRTEYSGSHDTYKEGEYMIYTDGNLYKCTRETTYSPEEYAQDWEKNNY